MADTLELAGHLKLFMQVSVATTVGEALTALRESSVDFALVVDDNLPMTLVQEQHLANLSGAEHQPLREALDQLPSPVLIDGHVSRLDVDYLVEVASLLQQSQSPGLVVYRDDQIEGIVEKETIANALPLSALVLGNRRLPGAALAHCYVCIKCGASRCPSDNAVPKCWRNRAHGDMVKKT